MTNSSLDLMTFAPNQCVNARSLISNSDFIDLINTKALMTGSVGELLSNAMAINTQSKLRTVRSIMLSAKDSKFIELKKKAGSNFVTISKCRDSFAVNGFAVEVTFYKRYDKHSSSSVAYYSMSEAILQCVKDGYVTACTGYHKELFHSDCTSSRINKRIKVIRALSRKD